MTADITHSAPPLSLVYIIAEESDATRLLDAGLSLNKYRVERYRDAQSFDAACRSKIPTVIVFEVEMDAHAEIAATIMDIQAGVAHQPPVIGVGRTNDIQQRLHAAACSVTRYVELPVEPVKFSRLVDSLTKIGTTPQDRILIVDDDRRVLRRYSDLLNDANMKTETLDDPFKTLELLDSFQPDLILLDLEMQALPGLELGKVIRQDNRHDHIPIIFMSDKSYAEQHQKLFDFGADGFITKTENINGLVAPQIATCTRRARVSKRLSDSYITALRKSRSRQQVLNQHAIVNIIDIDGILIFVNQKACDVSGYSKDEQVGQDYLMHHPHHQHDPSYAIMRETLLRGETWSGTFRSLTKDGIEYWIESTVVPFLDADGIPYQYVSASTDITETKTNATRLQQSQEYAGVGTWDWNISTGDLFWSECISDLLRFEKSENPRSFEGFVEQLYPPDQPRVANAVKACLDNGQQYDIEYRVVWPDRSIRWLHEKGDVLRDEISDEPMRMMGVIQDVTERKALELELSRYQRAMNVSMHGMAILNLDETFRFVNPAWAELHGYSEVAEIETSHWTLLVPEDHHEQYTGTIFPALEKTGHWHGESTSRRRDGSEFKQRLFLDVLGERGIVCTIQDITNEKDYEQVLLDAVQDAEQASQAKSSFLSSMSHELRTPLNAVIGFGQLIQLEADRFSQNQTSEYGNEIVNAGRHLLTLINDILDLATIESGKVAPKIQPIPVNETVTSCISLLNSLAYDANIEIKLNNGAPLNSDSAEKELYCSADLTRTKQALINLIGNAIKYNRANGKVTINCARVANGNIRISITDTGYGLTKNQQLKLFQPFQRLVPTHQLTSVEGTGIGLVITKNLVEQMNGSIGFESEPKKGSTFWIELPEDTTEIGDESNNEQPSLDIEASAFTEENIYNVLYIEDNAANVRLVEGLLRHRKDICLLIAQDATSGLALAEESIPDLILLDINLPIMDGFQVMQKLADNPQTSHIPVIAVSASAMKDDISKGEAAGFYRYLTKPIDLPSMINSIESALQIQ